jgi:TPR repeat protein
MLYKGEGTNKNFEKAIEMLLPLAEQQISEAVVLLDKISKKCPPSKDQMSNNSNPEKYASALIILMGGEVIH